MNTAPDASPDLNGGTSEPSLDPRVAASLLVQTIRQARRELEPSPPWLLVTRGVLVLAALGAIWLSVRGQHPYQGPTTADSVVLIDFVVANFLATVTARGHALGGVRGRSRLSRLEIIVTVSAWIVTALLMTMLAAAGNDYGSSPAAVIIIPGLAWAALMTARANWQGCAIGLGVATVGVAGILAGPAASWAVAGVGLCAVLMSHALVVLLRQHA